MFLGHIINQQGIWPTHDKLEALAAFKPPKSKQEVKSFLGFLTFLSKFMMDLATLTNNLRQLTKNDVRFEWLQQHQRDFEKIKKLITKRDHLKFFDTQLKTRLVTDASPVGLGAILMQLHGDVWLPVAYASKGLTETEMKFGQTEKEVLAIVWATERFHYYLYGRKFQILTDCKALKFLFGKKQEGNARIQRWVLRLLIYDFVVEIIPGENNIADALSRLVEFQSFNEVAGEHVLRIMVTEKVPRKMSLEEIRIATESDPKLMKVVESLQTGDWQNVEAEYAAFKDDICNVDGILLKNDRIIIPGVLESSLVRRAHEGHPGEGRMKRRLRMKVWFPKLEQKVTAFVKNCKGCAMVSAPECPLPLVTHSFPNKPFEEIVIDYKQVGSEMLLVIVCYYSRYVFYECIKPATSAETALCLEKVFGLYGVPKSIQCDNGSHFQGKVIELCRDYEVDMIRSAPRYPQANGQVERFNREIKKKVRIANGLGLNWKSELSKFLLVYHSTPHPALGGRTPAEVMFKRNIRDIIPQFETRNGAEDEEIREADAIYKWKAKKYVDKKRRAENRNLKQGDKVMMRNENPSGTTPVYGPEEFEVIGIEGSKVQIKSLEISDKVLERHVTHLKQLEAPEEPEETSEAEEEHEPEEEEEEGEIVENTSEEEVEKRRERKLPKYLQDYIVYLTQEMYEEDDL